MQRIGDRFFKENKTLFLRLTLVVLLGLSALGVVHPANRGIGQSVMAARPAFDGTDTDLLERQNKAYEGIVQATTPAIVCIRTEQVVKTEQSPLFMDPSLREFFGDLFPQIPWEQRQHALGSGVIFDPNGYIVTNNHVVDHANSVEVMLTDKRVYNARVVGSDPDMDIAVLKIDAKDPPTVPLGDSSTLHVGDTVMAFGNPFGLSFTVTRGKVSALGRSQFRIEPLQDFIQTDAAINPGNSGGALVDVKGQMVGINTAILSGNAGPGGEGGFMGIGFAIPVNIAKRSMKSLVKTGKVTRGYLGASVGPLSPELAKEFKVSDTCGALVQDVTRGGPADKAGLKPGDVIRKYDGRTVSESDELLAMVASTDPGATVSLEILRNGKPLTVKVTLDQRPSDLGCTPGRHRAPSAGPLRGISVKNLTPSLRTQLEIPADVSGVVVVDVDPDSPAADYLAQGDVILSVNHHPVNSVADFNNLAAEAKGQALLRIVHQGEILFAVISSEPGCDE
jgi:serine protease Do